VGGRGEGLENLLKTFKKSRCLKLLEIQKKKSRMAKIHEFKNSKIKNG
jgi:hypothetical protein